MDRREFLRIAGTAAGTLPVITFFNGFALSEETGEAVIATSAISRPSFCAPAIVKSGEIIPVEKTPGGQANIASAWLQAGGGGERFSINIDDRDCCERPPSLFSGQPLPPGLYDLYVEVSRGGNSRIERQPHAVKIVESFKTDFTFGVISDVHFGDPRLSSNLPGFDATEAVKKEIGILNNNQIEFCLCCGDLTFLPPATKKELQEYQEIFSELAGFPIFTVPGNHDGYTTGAAGKINFDTFKYWNMLYGPRDFSASYGNIAIIGVNTFDKPPEERNVYGGLGDIMDSGAISDDQLKRLESRLSDARARDSKTIILIAHHNPTNTVKDVNGPFETDPFSETGRKEFLQLIGKYKPDYLFAGHVHGVYEETYASTKIITVPTAGSLPAEGHPIGIDMAKVNGGKIASVETIELARL